MTDQQLFTLAVAFILPLSMLIYSNSRITEAKETLRAEIATLRAEMQKGFDKLSDQITALDVKLDNKLTLHELEHHK